MPQHFDLIVIGTGVAASAADICRAEGWNVAVIDSRPFGGTCAQRGCDPKKVLVDAARALDHVHRMRGLGIDPAGARIDWPELMAFKRTFTDPVPDATERRYREQGIATFRGHARFTDEKTVDVDGVRLTANRIVIAAGSSPRPLGIDGEEFVNGSDDFLALDDLPNQILFIGGGYISFEFAHLVARCGVGARILHVDDRPLPGFDPELVAILLEATRAAGIEVELNVRGASVEEHAGRLRVRAEKTGGGEHLFEAGMVVHGAGRIPQIGDLNLDAAGVSYGKRGIEVNTFLQSISNPDVYAAGDCANAGGLPLTPVASHQARIVAHNLLRGNSHTFDPSAIPSVAFTIPPIASVGLSLADAEERGEEIEIRHERIESWYSARHLNEKHAAYRTIVERGSRRVLGAHLIGSHADELINLFALAVRRGMRVDEILDVMYAYPTAASDVSSMLPDG